MLTAKLPSTLAFALLKSLFFKIYIWFKILTPKTQYTNLFPVQRRKMGFNSRPLLQRIVFLLNEGLQTQMFELMSFLKKYRAPVKYYFLLKYILRGLKYSLNKKNINSIGYINAE